MVTFRDQFFLRLLYNFQHSTLKEEQVMARFSSEFAYLDTTSPGKLSTIQRQIKLVNTNVPKDTMSGFVVGIPGSGKQCGRHREEYMAYGFDESRQIMVDFDSSVHYTQQVWQEQTGFKGLVACDSLENVCRKMWSNGQHIDMIDYDDVGYLRNRHLKMIENAAKYGVKAITLVITNRCNVLTNLHLEWKYRLGLEKRWLSPSKGWREPISDIHQGAIENTALDAGFDQCYFIPYAGRAIGPPMLSAVITRR